MHGELSDPEAYILMLVYRVLEGTLSFTPVKEYDSVKHAIMGLTALSGYSLASKEGKLFSMIMEEALRKLVVKGLVKLYDHELSLTEKGLAEAVKYASIDLEQMRKRVEQFVKANI